MDSLVTPSASSASASASASARASLRSETTNHPRKVRSACNRCYRQKLRCVKITGELDCERCSKLHTSCQYGLRAPRASLKTPVPGIWHERHSVPAFLSAPDANLDTVLTDESNSEWLLAPDVSAGADIAEDQGQFHQCWVLLASIHSFPNSPVNLIEITYIQVFATPCEKMILI